MESHRPDEESEERRSSTDDDLTEVVATWRSEPHHVASGRTERAEGVGFEPTDESPRQRFSRPSQSTTLPPLRGFPSIDLVSGVDRLARGLSFERPAFEIDVLVHVDQVWGSGVWVFVFDPIVRMGDVGD